MEKAWKILIVVLLILVVGIIIISKQDESATDNSNLKSNNDSDKSVQPVGGSDSETSGKQLPRLVDLGADKCIPCKMMAPILEELKVEYKGRFEVTFIDVWKKPDEAEKYSINSIPTQIFFDAAGAELFRHTGFMSKQDILSKWKELGVTID